MTILSDGMFPEYPCTYQPVLITPEWEWQIMTADIVQCLDYYTFGANACRIGHPRVVCYLNENVPFNPQYTGHALTNKQVIQAHAARIVATSTSVRDCLLTEGVNLQKIVQCPIWTTPVGFRPLFHMSDEETRQHLRDCLGLGAHLPVVLYVGRLSTAKGLDVLERSVTGMPLTLVMIGSEENYTPARWVHRQSHLLQEALIEWYNAADVVVLPSIPTVEWIEQYGRVLVEAQACGCPVIATDIGGPRDLVRQNETGFLVPPGNVASLRGAIQRIVEDKVLRDTFRRNARRWYLRQFETTKIERRLAHIYEDVMAEIPPETGIGGVNLEEAEETSGRIEIEA